MNLRHVGWSFLLIFVIIFKLQNTHAQNDQNFDNHIVDYTVDKNKQNNYVNNDNVDNKKPSMDTDPACDATPKPDHCKNEKPNIVIILIDDLGFNDLSFHGSNQIITPNIDALAYNGIILNRYYVPNLCTPSRASLLTGKNPIHTGTQHHVIINDEPWGLPLQERLMPEIFRENGYSTNLVGKWHLGFYKKEMTPIMRGFDHHYGYYSGYIDYWDYTHKMLDRNYSYGLDLRRNLKPWWAANGTYATDEFTDEAVRVINQHDTQKPLFMLLSHLGVHTGNEDDPMQAPQEEVDKFQHISNEKRRIYAGMISSVDRSVGKTVEALAEKGILNNTIILLYSDNGAPTQGIHANGGSNFPFRGQKSSPWEGGIRSAGLIYSPLLQKQSYVSNHLIHATDWLPTLAAAAGLELPKNLQLDGTDVWSSLSQQLPPKTRGLLHALDDKVHYLSYMRDGYKIVNGTSFNGNNDGWLGEQARTLEEEDPLAGFYVQTVLSSPVHKTIGYPQSKLNNAQVEKLRNEATWRCPKSTLGADPDDETYRCEPLKAACLFNIEEDPCERFNLAQLKPDILASLWIDIEGFRKTAVPPARVAYSDPNSDPALHNGTWEWWSDLSENSGNMSTKSPIWLSLVSGLMWWRN